MRAIYMRIVVRRTGRLIGTALRTALRAVVAWWQARRTVAELSALDDRVLKDIGLHRSQIVHGIGGGDATVRRGRRRDRSQSMSKSG